MSGEWAPGIPQGRFWLPPYGDLPFDGELEFQTEASMLAPKTSARMIWLTAGPLDVPRCDLSLRLLDDDELVLEAPAMVVPSALSCGRGYSLDVPAEDSPERVRGFRLNGLARVVVTHHAHAGSRRFKTVPVRPVMVFTE